MNRRIFARGLLGTAFAALAAGIFKSTEAIAKTQTNPCNGYDNYGSYGVYGLNGSYGSYGTYGTYGSYGNYGAYGTYGSYGPYGGYGVYGYGPYYGYSTNDVLQMMEYNSRQPNSVKAKKPWANNYFEKMRKK